MTINERNETMRQLRAEGVPDAVLARCFGLSKQRIGKILGPNGNGHALPKPAAAVTADDEESILADLPAWLRGIRRRLNCSQTSMAELIGVSLRAYSDWERDATGCSLPILLIRYLSTTEKNRARKAK